MDYLKDIIEHKKRELIAAKSETPLGIILEKLNDIKEGHTIKSFKENITAGKPGFICEIKRRSPSKGTLREILDPVEIAKQYDKNGAAAISVLTDNKYFNGSLNDLKKVKERVNKPVLRKDFIIDPYQLYESKLAGADAVLLITSAMNTNDLKNLYSHAYDLGLEVLVEVESVQDIKKLSGMEVEIIGVNNRNLHTFEQNIEKSVELFSELPVPAVKISESGLKEPEHISKLFELGYDGFLIGETFIRSESPGNKLKEYKDIFK